MNDQIHITSNDPMVSPERAEKRNRSTCITILGIGFIAGVLLVGFLAVLVGPRLLAFFHTNIGRTYYEQDDFERAISEFDRAIKLYPSFKPAYESRAIAYFGKGDLDHAIADFNRLIELSPNYPGSYYNRGLAYFYQGKYDKAITDFSQTITLAPEYIETYFQRGHAYIRVEEYSLAIADYDTFIEQYPNHAVAYNNRCWSYFKMGEYEEALPDCEKSIDLEPDNVNTLDSRARVYNALGRTEEAIEDFKHIIELGTNPELTRQAKAELSGLTSSDEKSTEIRYAKPGANLAYRKSVIASRALSNFPVAMAVDGNENNWWGSGAFAPQWIQIDLGANYVITEVRLLPSQSPTGKTVHRILVKGLATNHEYVLLRTFEEVTRDSKWLIFKTPEPLQGIRYIKIESTSSPSWISWREIEVIAGE